MLVLAVVVVVAVVAVVVVVDVDDDDVGAVLDKKMRAKDCAVLASVISPHALK